MRYKFIGTTLFFLLLISGVFFIGRMVKQEKRSPNDIKFFKFNSIKKIPQPDDYFVAMPLKMIGYKDKIYILDAKFSMILVFSKNGFSHTIGRPGKGPSEFSYGTSFCINDDTLYLLNEHSKIEVFLISGEYLRTIRIKKTDAFSIPTDIDVYNKCIYICFSFGRIKVQRQFKENDKIDKFIVSDKRVDTDGKKHGIIAPVSIYIVPEKKSLILIDQFRGDIEVYDLEKGSLQNTIEKYDSEITEKIERIEDDFNSYNSGSASNQVKSISMWRSSFDRLNNRIILIPSQVSIKPSQRRKLFYHLNCFSEELHKATIKVKNEETVIRDCCFIKDKWVVLDYDSNIFTGE